MNTTLFLAVPLWIAGLIAEALDYYVTVKGLEQGVAEEGNPIVRWLYGVKPGKLQLLVVELAQDFLGLTAATLTLIFLPNPGLGLGIGAAVAVRHVYDFFQWKKLGVKFE